MCEKDPPTPAGSAPPHCPPPDRDCPHRIFDAHEIHPDDDNDWTISRANGGWNKEWQLRWDRNVMIKAMLKQGRSVQYKSSGNSLWPWVHSGDCCIFEPAFDCATLIAKHDVVFCEVQPGNRFFAHIILRIEYEDTSSSSAASAQTPRRTFYIGNMSEHENGWCYDEHMYGRLIEVIM